MCCDMWLLGDYLARYYSLCEISILAPVFVMVINFGFVSAMSFGFVSAMSTCFVSANWFQLCVDDCHVALG